MSIALLVKELREMTGAGMLDCKKALEESNNDIESAVSWLREKGIAKAAKKSGRIAAEGVTLAKATEDGKLGVILELNCETDFVTKNDEFIQFKNDLMAMALSEKPQDLDAFLALDLNGKSVADTIVDKTATIGEKIELRRYELFVAEADTHLSVYVHGEKIATLVELRGSSDEALGKQVAMHIAASSALYIERADIPEGVVDKEKEILRQQAKNEGKSDEIAEKMLTGRLEKFYKEVALVEQPFVMDSDKTVAQALGSAKVSRMVTFKLGEGIEKKEENFAEEVAKAQRGE